MDDLDFLILPSRIRPGFPGESSYHRAYDHYRQTWQRICDRPGRPKHFSGEGFLRQDYIFQIEQNGKVVAQSTATHYTLQSLMVEDLPVFECFKGEPLEVLRSKGLNHMYSVEFTSVAPEYRPRTVGFNFYKVILQLCIMKARETGSDAIFGHPRRLTKTNELVEEIGCKPLGHKKNKWGVSVDLFYGELSELGPYNDEFTERLASSLWDKRIDLTLPQVAAKQMEAA